MRDGHTKRDKKGREGTEITVRGQNEMNRATLCWVLWFPKR